MGLEAESSPQEARGKPGSGRKVERTGRTGERRTRKIQAALKSAEPHAEEKSVGCLVNDKQGKNKEVVSEMTSTKGKETTENRPGWKRSGASAFSLQEGADGDKGRGLRVLSL